MTDKAPSQHFCNKCGRVLLSVSPQFKYWLVSRDGTVVRCPQHITDWAMRRAGMRRTKTTNEWRKQAKEQDIPPTNILIEPFFD